MTTEQLKMRTVIMEKILGATDVKCMTTADFSLWRNATLTAINMTLIILEEMEDY